MIALNQEFRHDFSFTQKQVEAFAEVTGDKNPVHLDAAYAATTMFKVPIMHGMLSACIFSKVFGTLFPGEGTIYLSQTLQFRRPMLVDTQYEAVFTVKTIESDKNRATIETTILDKSTQKPVTTGEAVVMNTSQIK